jgi:hypothetical protein
MDTLSSTGPISDLAFVLALALGISVHLFFGYCLKRIVEKTGDDDVADMWWIPVVNVILLLRAADKSGWWLLLLLIPGINIVAVVVLWVETSKKLGKGVLWGLIAALVVGIPYLAFSEDEPAIAQ